MMLPGERALREERHALIETMHSLPAVQFDTAATLCAGWSPRDILAHVMGVDVHFAQYVRAGGWINTANEVIVANARRLTREELLSQAEQWVSRPAPWSRGIAPWLLGDNAIHHEDVLRPLGRTRDYPEASRKAMLREGMGLGVAKLLRYRIEPTDGGRPVGRGINVRGTRSNLAMWLAGRQGYEHELEFNG